MTAPHRWLYLKRLIVGSFERVFEINAATATEASAFATTQFTMMGSTRPGATDFPDGLHRRPDPRQHCAEVGS
jgi:hypothetical protein